MQDCQEHFAQFHLSGTWIIKKGFIKGEALLRTNSVKEIFKLRKLEFLARLLERGYPRQLAEKILAEVNFSSWSEALLHKTTTSNNVLPFLTTFNLATPNLKEIFMKHWHLITEKHKLAQTFPKPPLVAYQKDKSLKDILVRAKISSHI